MPPSLLNGRMRQHLQQAVKDQHGKQAAPDTEISIAVKQPVNEIGKPAIIRQAVIQRQEKANKPQTGKQRLAAQEQKGKVKTDQKSKALNPCAGK